MDGRRSDDRHRIYNDDQVDVKSIPQTIQSAPPGLVTMDGADHHRAMSSPSVPVSNDKEAASCPSPIRNSDSTSTPRRSHRRNPSRGTDTIPTSTASVGRGGGGPGIESHAEPSLADRISATALAGTMELLKQVGGVTLSTTGALVAPPLHITRTVLLPSLWAAVRDYISTASPVRLKDWFRIVHSSIYHVIHTLQNTEAGHTFSNRLLLLAADVLECLCAETTRQLLLDSMASAVKFSEMISTPESEACLEQWVITLCRAIDALSNGKNKLVLHDLQQAVWSFCQLAADPATTTALAEVTAYLCYALEMEQQKLVEDALRNPNTGAQQQQRRLERNQYQRRVVVDKDLLVAGRTVEEAILSSLGNSTHYRTPLDNDDYDEDGPMNGMDSVPNSIAFDGTKATSAATPTAQNVKTHRSLDGIVDRGSSSIPPSNATEGVPKSANDEEWHERARKDVDVQRLREGIEQRSVNILAEKHQRQHQQKHEQHANSRSKPALVKMEVGKAVTEENNTDNAKLKDFEDIAVTTIGLSGEEDSDDDNDAANGSRRRQRAVLDASFVVDDADDNVDVKETSAVGFMDQQKIDWNPSQSPGQRLDGETALQHFHRVLDEILTAKRDEAVHAAVTTGGYHSSDDSYRLLKKAGKLRKNPTTTAPGTTVKDRLAAIRAELIAGPSQNEMERLNRIKNVLGKEGRMILILGLAAVAVVSMFWISFGCYGIYVFFRRPSTIHPVAPASLPVPQREIVIRIVREMGSLERDQVGFNTETMDDSSIEQIAQCVDNVLN